MLKQLEEKKREYENLVKSIEQESRKEEKLQSKLPENLRLGQKVYVKSFDAEGFVESLPDSKGNLTVRIGIMKLSVNISDIFEIEEETAAKNLVSSQKTIEVNQKSIDMSIDVRGKTSDDAILEVDKYLDDAYTAGLKQVTIIHGKGTGVLRQTIRSFLRRHPHVKSFRDGTYGEGEQGVTVVELKD